MTCRWLLDGESATATLRAAGLPVDAALPRYVRHKPTTSTIVGYRLHADGRSTSGYVRWFRHPHEAAAAHAKARTRRLDNVTLPAVCRVDANSVFWGFPNDARLPRLRWYSTARKLKRTFAPSDACGTAGDEDGPTVDLGIGRVSARRSTVEVLAYTPERRVVVGAELVGTHGRRAVVVRASAFPRGPMLADVATTLRAHEISTPRPLAVLDGGCTYVDERLAGSTLAAAIADNRAADPTENRAAHDPAEELAAMVAALHAVRPPAGVPQRTVAAALTSANAALGALAALDAVTVDASGADGRAPAGTLTPVANRLAVALRLRPPVGPPPVLVHGDLHLDNVLVHAAGMSLIDLERVAVGAAESDLAQLRAAAWTAARRRSAEPPIGPDDVRRGFVGQFLEAYRRRRPIDAAALDWFTAAALVDQALLAARRIEPTWRTLAAELLDDAVVLATSHRPGSDRR